MVKFFMNFGFFITQIIFLCFNNVLYICICSAILLRGEKYGKYKCLQTQGKNTYYFIIPTNVGGLVAQDLI